MGNFWNFLSSFSPQKKKLGGEYCFRTLNTGVLYAVVNISGKYCTVTIICNSVLSLLLSEPHYFATCQLSPESMSLVR